MTCVTVELRKAYDAMASSRYYAYTRISGKARKTRSPFPCLTSFSTLSQCSDFNYPSSISCCEMIALGAQRASPFTTSFPLLRDRKSIQHFLIIFAFVLFLLLKWTNLLPQSFPHISSHESSADPKQDVLEAISNSTLGVRPHSGLPSQFGDFNSNY